MKVGVQETVPKNAMECYGAYADALFSPTLYNKMPKVMLPIIQQV